jgi:hypothetical protein
MDPWPFADPPNVAVITLRSILEGGQPILLVCHDESDGGWQFLSGGDCETADAMVVGLAEMFRYDPTIGELSDLPLGWQAWRAEADGVWMRAPKPEPK